MSVNQKKTPFSHLSTHLDTCLSFYMYINAMLLLVIDQNVDGAGNLLPLYQPTYLPDLKYFFRSRGPIYLPYIATYLILLLLAALHLFRTWHAPSSSSPLHWTRKDQQGIEVSHKGKERRKIVLDLPTYLSIRTYLIIVILLISCWPCPD